LTMKTAVRDRTRRTSCFPVSPPRAKGYERRVARRVTGDVAHRRATLCASPRCQNGFVLSSE
jgi:hypothetical protein